MADQSLSAAADALRASDALLITAGAGLGVDSGFPDFRGNTGFWNAYPPYARLGIEFYDLACPDTLNNDPTLFWGFYEHRRILYRDTEPHAGYKILKELAATRSTFVFTSNVDGHFFRAGFSEDQVVECHGTINYRQCATPCCEAIWAVKEETTEVDGATMRAVGELPRCPSCQAVARPNVLMFNDSTWVGERTERQHEHYDDWQRSIRGARLVVLELGAGTGIPTVRHEGSAAATRHRGILIRVNPREFALDSRGGISLPGTALATLRTLSALL